MIGLGIPYVVAALPTMLFDVRSMDFHKLMAWDAVTSWLTIGAFVLGAALCWPWLKLRLTGTSPRIRWIAFGLIALVVQFAAVFVVRLFVFWIY